MFGAKNNKIQGKYGHLEIELNSEIGRIEKFQKRRHSEISADIEGLKNDIRRMNKFDVTNKNTTGRRNSLPSAYPSVHSKKSVKDSEIPSTVVMEARTLLKVVEKRRKSLEIEKKLYLENLENKSRSQENNQARGLRRLSLDLNVPLDWLDGIKTEKNVDSNLKLPVLKTENNRSKDHVNLFSDKIVSGKKKLVKSFSDPTAHSQLSDGDELSTDLMSKVTHMNISDGQYSKPNISRSEINSKEIKETDLGTNDAVGVPANETSKISPDKMLIRRFSMPEFTHARKSQIVPLSIHEENEEDGRESSVFEPTKEHLSACKKSTSNSAFSIPRRRSSISLDITDFVPKVDKHKHRAVPGHSEKRLLMRRNSAYLLTKHLLEIKETLPTQTLLEIERLKHDENIMLL